MAAKMAFMALAASLSLISWSVGPLLLGSGAAVAVYLVSSRGSSQLRSLVKAVVYTVFTYVPVQALFYWGYYMHKPSTVILYLVRPGGGIVGALTGGMGIALTVQGVEWGILTSLKFLITFFASVAFLAATEPSEVIYLLRKIGAPSWAIAASSIAISMLPYSLSDARTAVAAVMKRDIRGVRAALKPIYAVKALVYQAVRRAYMISLSLEQKGYPAFDVAPRNSGAGAFLIGSAALAASIALTLA